MNPKEVMRPKVGVGCMLLRDNKILLGLRHGSHGAFTYGWLGGHLEFGETLEQCAERKVYEESGIILDELRLLCVSNVLDYGKHYLDIEFVSTRFRGEPRLLKSEIISWDWYDLDNLPGPLFSPVEKAIESYKNNNIYNP